MNQRLNFRPAELAFLANLNRLAVSYLVTGGYAVKFYGCREDVRDLDLLIDHSPENVKRLIPLIEQYLGQVGYKLQCDPLDFTSTGKQWKSPDQTIDILTSIQGVEFNTLYENHETAYEQGLAIPIMARQDLIKLKKRVSRSKDREQREALDLRCLEARTAALKVKTSILVLAVILFIGVVVMAYGYFHNNSLISYLGLFVTGATSLAIIFQTLISQNGARKV